MSNMHRIIWFDERVRSGQFPNSSLLAQHFEISRRQAARDIEYLASSLRAPLQYVAKRRGYCYTNTTFLLPVLYMTAEEKQVLKYLAHRYRNYNYEHGDQVRRVASLLERFDEGNPELGSNGDPSLSLEQGRLPIFHVQPHILQHMDVLRHAMANQLVLRLDYRDQDGEHQMLGMPLRFTSRYHADYVTLLPHHAVIQQPHLNLRLDGILRIRPADSPLGTPATETAADGRANYRARGNTGNVGNSGNSGNLGHLSNFRNSGDSGNSGNLGNTGNSGNSGSLQLVPYHARVQLAGPLVGGVWGGFCAALEEDATASEATSAASAPAPADSTGEAAQSAEARGEVYKISFYDIELFIQHLLVADWERLLSPQWLIERLEMRCSQTLLRLGKGTTDEGR